MAFRGNTSSRKTWQLTEEMQIRKVKESHSAKYVQAIEMIEILIDEACPKKRVAWKEVGEVSSRNLGVK